MRMITLCAINNGVWFLGSFAGSPTTYQAECVDVTSVEKGPGGAIGIIFAKQRFLNDDQNN